MKLRQNEEAVELLADIVEPAIEIFTDPEIANAMQKDSSIVLIKKALKRHSKEVVDIMAALDGIDRKKAKYTIPVIIKKLMELVNDKELLGFFTELAQQDSEIISGSATANTTADVTK